MSRRLLRALDFLVWAPAWGNMLLSLLLPQVSTMMILMGVVFIPVATMIWMHVRIAPRVFILAQPSLREEIALTLIAPQDFLIPRIRPHIAHLLVPAIATWLINGVFLIGTDPWFAVFWFMLPTGFSCVAISLACLFHLFHYYCRQRATKEDVSPFAFFISLVFSTLFPLTPLLTFLAPEAIATFAFALWVMVGFMIAPVLSVFWVSWSWRRVQKIYLTFPD